MSVKKQIKDYILEGIDDAGYEVINEDSSIKDKLQFIADNFTKEACYPANLLKFKNNKGCIIADHLMGLPSYVNIAFSNYDILQIGKKWGFTLETEKKEDYFLNNWWSRIAQNIMELFRTHDIKF